VADFSTIIAFLHTRNKLDLILYQLGVKKETIIELRNLKFKIRDVSLTE
jgi:hypothetical protein